MVSVAVSGGVGGGRVCGLSQRCEEEDMKMEDRKMCEGIANAMFCSLAVASARCSLSYNKIQLSLVQF